MKLSGIEIKKILEETAPFTPQIGVEVEDAVSNQEFKFVNDSAQSDYRQLCQLLGLSPVPVDVFLPSKESTNRTPLGTPVNNFTPLYDTGRIVLPIVAGASGTLVCSKFAFPPGSWEIMSPEWPRWRLDLWHEVLHQVEYDILNTWKGGEVHGESYMEAIGYTVEKLKSLRSISKEELRILALGG